MSIHILLCYYIKKKEDDVTDYGSTFRATTQTHTFIFSLSSAGFFSFVVVNSWKGPIKLKRIVRGFEEDGGKEKKIIEETQKFLSLHFIWITGFFENLSLVCVDISQQKRRKYKKKLFFFSLWDGRNF